MHKMFMHKIIANIYEKKNETTQARLFVLSFMPSKESLQTSHMNFHKKSLYRTYTLLMHYLHAHQILLINPPKSFQKFHLNFFSSFFFSSFFFLKLTNLIFYIMAYFDLIRQVLLKIFYSVCKKNLNWLVDLKKKICLDSKFTVRG